MGDFFLNPKVLGLLSVLASKKHACKYHKCNYTGEIWNF